MERETIVIGRLQPKTTHATTVLTDGSSGGSTNVVSLLAGTAVDAFPDAAGAERPGPAEPELPPLLRRLPWGWGSTVPPSERSLKKVMQKRLLPNNLMTAVDSVKFCSMLRDNGIRPSEASRFDCAPLGLWRIASASISERY